MTNINDAEADPASANLNLLAALSYAERGWYIYPAFPGTKSKTNLKWRTASTNWAKSTGLRM